MLTGKMGIIGSCERQQGMAQNPQMVKKLPTVQDSRVSPLGQEDPLEEGTATRSSVPAWRTPQTEESGGLQSVGSQKGLTHTDQSKIIK